MGCERLVAMLIEQNREQVSSGCDVYLAMRGEGSIAVAHRIGENLRDQLPGLRLVVHAGAGSFKSQMRKADRSGANIALILGDAEIENDTVTVKYLREDKAQEEYSQAEIAMRLESLAREL